MCVRAPTASSAAEQPKGPRSKLLRKPYPKLARIVAQHDQHIVPRVEPCIVIPLVRDVPAVDADRPTTFGRPIADVGIDQVAAVDVCKPRRITARLTEHVVPERPIRTQRDLSTPRRKRQLRT